MSRSNFLTISAIGVFLAAVPGIALAQAAQTPAAQPPAPDVTLFVPLVDACVSMPSPETCQQVRAVVTECAADFAEEGCAVLLSVPDMVFNDPAQMQLAQTALSVTATEIAGMTFADVDHSVVDEASRADAERTFLRGDENLMAHSAPPVLDGDETAAESKAAADAEADPATE
jgi:hypothetical protein